MDYRAMYDREFIGAWDLAGKDVTVVISKVEGAEIIGENNKKSKRPVLSFKGKDKKMVVNKTNGKTIATMYGTDVRGWLDKPITLYGTKARLGKDMVDAIRVRPGVPKERPAGADQPRPTEEDPMAPPAQDGAQ